MRGDLGYDHARAVRPILTELISTPDSITILNLARVPYFDASGARLLVDMTHVAAAAPSVFHIDAPSNAVRRVFALLRLDDRFTILWPSSRCRT